MARPNITLDLLRTDRCVWEALLAELDARVPSDAERKLRRHDRHPYRVREGLLFTFSDQAVRDRWYVVRPRNLSCGGIAFLHGGYVHAGVPCTVTLKTLDGEFVSAPGVVVRSRYVGDRAHEVKVKFDRDVEVENFVPSAVYPRQGPCEYCPDEVGARLASLSYAVSNLAPINSIRELLAQLDQFVAAGLPPGFCQKKQPRCTRAVARERTSEDGASTS